MKNNWKQNKGMFQKWDVSINNRQKSREKHLANYKQLYSLYGLDFCSASRLKHALYLSEFPGDADSPAEAIATNEQSLHGPASKVAEGKDVTMAQEPLPRYSCTVYSIFLQNGMDDNKHYDD